MPDNLSRKAEECEACGGSGGHADQESPRGKESRGKGRSGWQTCGRCKGTGLGPLPEIEEE